MIHGNPKDYQSPLGEGEQANVRDNLPANQSAQSSRHIGQQSAQFIQNYDEPGAQSFMGALHNQQEPGAMPTWDPIPWQDEEKADIDPDMVEEGRLENLQLEQQAGARLLDEPPTFAATGEQDDRAEGEQDDFADASVASEMQAAKPQLASGAVVARKVAEALLEAEHREMNTAYSDNRAAHLAVMANAYREAISSAAKATGQADDGAIRKELEKQASDAKDMAKQLQQAMDVAQNNLAQGKDVDKNLMRMQVAQEHLEAANQVRNNAKTLLAMMDAAGKTGSPSSQPGSQQAGPALQPTSDLEDIVGGYALSGGNSSQHLGALKPKLATNAAKTQKVAADLQSMDRRARRNDNMFGARLNAQTAAIFRSVVEDAIRDNGEANDETIKKQIQHRQELANQLAHNIQEEQEQATRHQDGDALIEALNQAGDLAKVQMRLNELQRLFES